MAKAKELPAHPMVELELGDIDGGDLLGDINAEIRKAYAAIVRAENEKDGASFTASVGIKLKIGREGRQTFVIESDITSKLPRPKRISLVKEKDGKLLCPMDGARRTDPDQLQHRFIYDDFGRATHQLNKATGEIEAVEAVEPVGKIGAAG